MEMLKSVSNDPSKDPILLPFEPGPTNRINRIGDVVIDNSVPSTVIDRISGPQLE
jgi:hypothetical protein